VARKKGPASEPAPYAGQSAAAWAKRAALAERRALRALRTGGSTTDALAADIVRRAKRRESDARRKGREPSDKFAAAARRGRASKPERAPKGPPAKRPPRELPPPAAPVEYVARVAYTGRKHGSRVVELRLLPPDGRAVTKDDVRRVVVNLARGKEPPAGWRYFGLAYGRTADTLKPARGNVHPSELGGLLMRGDKLTVGEEPRE
jgi:hypothetical protein